MKYRKKPVVIEAERLTADNVRDVADWVHSHTYAADGCEVSTLPNAVLIQTLEGTMRADIGDYVIRGVQGEFYPCKPDIFDATYEPADDAKT